MVSIDTFRKFALSFPETTEETHFEKTSFRVKKKIFATYDERKNRACIKLSEIDQDVFSSADRTMIYPVDNKWGKKGWTLIEMNKVPKDLFIDALTTFEKSYPPFCRFSSTLGIDHRRTNPALMQNSTPHTLIVMGKAKGQRKIIHTFLGLLHFDENFLKKYLCS